MISVSTRNTGDRLALITHVDFEVRKVIATSSTGCLYGGAALGSTGDYDATLPTGGGQGQTVSVP